MCKCDAGTCAYVPCVGDVNYRKSWNLLTYKVFLKTLSYEEKSGAIAAPGSSSLIRAIRGQFWHKYIDNWNSLLNRQSMLE